MDKMEIVIELPKDIDKLCRTCMNIVEEDRKSCVATDCSDQGIDLNKMLSQLMESNGSSEEYLPKFMCKNCVDKLESAYLFTQQCQNTYMHFQDFMYPAEKVSIEEIRAFTCTACNESFATQYSLSKHEIVHYKKINLLTMLKDKDDTEIKCNVNDSVEEISSLVNDRKEEINERNEIKLKTGKENQNVFKSNIYQELIKQTKLYSCDLCGRVFDTDLSLHLHFVNHAILAEGNTDPDIFNQYICCRTCGETFNCYEDLEDHQNSCLEFNKFKCTRCNKVFTSELNLLQHENELLHFNSEWEKLKLESTTKCFYMCPICDGMFTTKSELSLHSIREGDGLPNLMCVQCVLQCSRAYTFKQQCEKSENILRQYMTPEFQEQLSQHLTNQTKVELQEQLQFSSNIDRVIVDQLPTEFVSVEYGDQNISIVKDEFVLINEVTGDIVAQIENQEKNDQLIEECSNEPPNEQTEEELKPLKYPCSKCKESFALKVDLKIHMMTHPKELEHICHVCQKGFTQSGYVGIHMRTHTGERPYVCTTCGKAFAGSNTLAIHQRIHTGEKPYPCTLCGKSFSRHETLVIHTRSHTGHKPHICSVCKKGFTSSGHLSGHMRTHTGEKPHGCTVCDKRFAGSSSLKAHMRGHIEEKQFICKLCSKSFAQMANLQQHMLTHSAVTKPQKSSKVEAVQVAEFRKRGHDGTARYKHKPKSADSEKRHSSKPVKAPTRDVRVGGSGTEIQTLWRKRKAARLAALSQPGNTTPKM
ncbi:hypothetical protein MML48_3g00005501 [Holotrichia oblita]|uniref:Uncharacterized protein n=1 Tax=Holotrichia oblita TaxID=644536 RepID=A0ACB9TDW8_HOLOL|nr:hypothetical protein MML48_3g00005501 [Holotrichia oblita]